MQIAALGERPAPHNQQLHAFVRPHAGGSEPISDIDHDNMAVVKISFLYEHFSLVSIGRRRPYLYLRYIGRWLWYRLRLELSD
jgi:hypothetical protein